MNPTRIGINGFGRVGRSVAKILSSCDELQIAAVNDLTEDVGNLAYLYNFDSTYGRPEEVAETDGNMLRIGGTEIVAHCQERMADVPWQDSGIDFVVDSSGVEANLTAAHELVDSGAVKKVVATNSPTEGVDKTIIMGANDSEYNPESHHVLSASICDANAIVHVLLCLESRFGIEHGFVTTLHPWLSYQNLVDAPVRSQSQPSAFWTDYSLGRASTGTLIPKKTTAIQAITQVLPQFKGKLEAISFRIPTDVVTTADATLNLASEVSLDVVEAALRDFADASPYLSFSTEPLLSVDFKKRSESAIIDGRWLRVLSGRMVKCVLWYDNEWGYSCRVVDLLKLLNRRTTDDELSFARRT
jgi:glyceraldehyde 3-phosphate dehydrogenase